MIKCGKIPDWPNMREVPVKTKEHNSPGYIPLISPSMGAASPSNQLPRKAVKA